jgi:hypothetical protein
MKFLTRDLKAIQQLIPLSSSTLKRKTLKLALLYGFFRP